MSRRAVFRADAGPRIGGGHVSRCLTLAAALSEAGWRVALAVSAETASHAARLLGGFEILIVGPGDEAAAMKARWPEGTDWLVLDHYGRDAALERACRPWAARILVLDDLADRPHDCDLLLDSGLTRRPADYNGLVPPGTPLLLGPDHALLKPQFRAKRAASLARRREGRLNRVLVSFGLGEAAAFTAMALQGIRASGLELAVDVVVGPGFPVPDAAPGFVWHQGLSDLSGLMAGCDLAIGAGGTTSWERCCLGVPTLLALMAENQRDNVAALAGRAAARHVQDGDAVAAALRGFAADPAALAAMARAAAGLCDGGGTERAVAALG